MPGTRNFAQRRNPPTHESVLAEGLRAGANFGYTNAFYPNAAYGSPVNGVTPLLNGTGEKLANVLPWTASVHAEYSRDIGSITPLTRRSDRTKTRRTASPPFGP